MRPCVVSISSVFCGSAPAGRPFGACAKRGRGKQQRSQRERAYGSSELLVLTAGFRRRISSFSRAATGAGTKAVMSPPILAIWRTKVAVIGRTAGLAGRNTVWIAGAMVPFIPAICIS